VHQSGDSPAALHVNTERDLGGGLGTQRLARSPIPVMTEGGDIPTAVVTGAASGIGSALATRLTATGAQVLLADIDDQAVHQLADKLQGRCCVGDARGVPGHLSNAQVELRIVVRVGGISVPA
jgi:hypothetical protein